VPPPALDDDPRFGEGVEDFSVEQLVAQAGVETLDEAILPRAARRDVGGFRADGGYPLMHSLGDELRAIVGTNVLGNIAQDEQIREHVDDIDGFQPPVDANGDAFMRELIDDVQHPVFSPVMGAILHRIGEDVSERLDVVPAQFRVLVTRRPKYACRACEEGVTQAPAPARLIEGGLPTEATVAHVLISKYADHLPLYRQAQIYARQGIDLDRSTLADWVGRPAWHVRPLHERLLEHIRASTKIFADETTAPVLDPGRGRTKTGQLWAYARDDRPFGGVDPTIAVYVYAQNRKAEQPLAHLAGFAGVVQVDGYAGYRALARRNSVQLAFCWSHVRRRFYELAVAGPAPIAAQALERIGALYAVERDIRGRNPDERRDVRQEKSRPIIDALEPWLRDKLALISQKTKLAEAIRYALSRWEGLTRFIDDGRIEIDSNVVERAIRPIALNRKNALFAGSDGGAESWAIAASLIETCKLNGVDPQAYMADVLTKIVDGHLASKLDELMPWAYVPLTALRHVA
jgi:transposase